MVDMFCATTSGTKPFNPCFDISEVFAEFFSCLTDHSHFGNDILDITSTVITV